MGLRPPAGGLGGRQPRRGDDRGRPIGGGLGLPPASHTERVGTWP